jgi:hypothetical protein
VKIALSLVCQYESKEAPVIRVLLPFEIEKEVKYVPVNCFLNLKVTCNNFEGPRLRGNPSESK